MQQEKSWPKDETEPKSAQYKCATKTKIDFNFDEGNLPLQLKADQQKFFKPLSQLLHFQNGLIRLMIPSKP